MSTTTPVLLLAALFLLPAASHALIGGWQPIANVSDPAVQDVAGFAVGAIVRVSHVPYDYRRVISGETQVVAGTNYKLVLEVADPFEGTIVYEVLVYDKPWEHFRNLTSYSPPPGGWMAIEDVHDAGAQDAARFAVAEIGRRKGLRALRFRRVNYGESQVVAGTNYRLEVAAAAAGGGRSRRRTFHVQVYVNPWEKRKELTWFKVVRR